MDPGEYESCVAGIKYPPTIFFTTKEDLDYNGPSSMRHTTCGMKVLDKTSVGTMPQPCQSQQA